MNKKIKMKFISLQKLIYMIYYKEGTFIVLEVSACKQSGISVRGEKVALMLRNAALSFRKMQPMP